jgi:hypothetical protein
MEITLSKTVHEKFILTPNQVDGITKARLLRFLDGGTFLQDMDGKLMLCCWECTGHGSGLTETIREATPTDITIVQIIRTLSQGKEN